MYVDDLGCVKLGIVVILLIKNECLINVEIEELIIFEENYIKVIVYNCKIKQKNECIFDFFFLEIYLLSNNIEI